MRHSLNSHILQLEDSVQSLRDRLTGMLTPDERHGLELQLSTAELALVHYREASALEPSVSGPEPSGHTHTGANGGSGTREESRPERKKDGLTGVAARMRKPPCARLRRPGYRSGRL